jgi:hypothetical protein
LPVISLDILDSSLLEIELMNIIPMRIPNSTYFAAMICDIIGQNKEGIFSSYSYNETEKQFLNYPYDYFAFNLNIDYRLPIGCLEELINSTSICRPDIDNMGIATITNGDFNEDFNEDFNI